MSEVKLVVDDKGFSGWKSVTIERGIEQVTGTFEVAVSDVAPDGDAATRLKPGSKVALVVDGETLITGYIDELQIAHNATSHTLSVRGSDATVDLVQCSAIHSPGEWNNKDMLAIATDLLKPFKLAVRSTTSVGKPFAQWNIEPGETVFENLDRMARHRGVLLASDGKGGLLITQPGTDKVSTALVLGENILSGYVTHSHHNRFSEYTVKGQRQRDDDNDALEASGPKGTATDAEITRHRPFLVVYEDANATKQTLTDRAKWQRNVNAAQAQRVVMEVQGWSHAAGLWHPNKLVSVTDKHLRLDNTELLIATVRMTLDSQGTRTELQLAPRNAYLVDQQPEALPL